MPHGSDMMSDEAMATACGALSRRAVLATGTAALASPFAGSAHGATPPPGLDEWLRAFPRIANAVVWDFGKGLQPWPAWPEPFKAKLRQAYARAWNNEPSGLVDPPPNQTATKDEASPATSLTGEHAFALHAAHVGNGLAVEIGRRVPWSVADYPDAALLVLFSGNHFFRRDGANYRLALQCIPASPEATLAFLRANKIIAADRRATIVQMLGWCRDRLVHFGGDVTTQNFYDHWQYRGMPPASRIISGTRFLGPISTPGYDPRRRYTAGCWGTTTFLAATLRAINIPVQRVGAPQWSRFAPKPETHTTPWFMVDDLYLSHGDDPYNNFCAYQPSFDVGEILLTKAQFEAWFPPGAVPTAETPRNVGRRVFDLAIQHLPIRLLHYHALDVLKKKTRQAGEVYDAFKGSFTLADLEKAQLWARLDRRLAELGGPEKVEALYTQARERADRLMIPTDVK
jgi:hypothetical protein